MRKRRKDYSSVIIAVGFVVAIIWYLWPIFVGAGAIWLLWRFYKQKSMYSGVVWNSAPKKHVTRQKTVAYIIIKDGYGKFGITKRRKQGEAYSVRKRYNNEYLKILWTTTLASRGEGYEFERYCKTRINRILKGKEWFSETQAPQLVADVKAAGY
jgi:hypothetical protein